MPPSVFVLLIIALAHGVFLTVIPFMFMNAEYEDELYDTMIDIADLDDLSQASAAISLMKLSHRLIAPRHKFFAKMPMIPRLLRSADIQLIDGRGACASYSHVLGRLLEQAGLEFRIVQMTCFGGSICHILIEAYADGKWMVLDPLYDLVFRRPDGSYASAAEVSGNWTYFKAQVPSNYDPIYRYEGFQYTNWDKIPVVMPMIKSALDWLMGAEADKISVRAHVLNLYRTLGWLALCVYAPLVILSIFCGRRWKAGRA